MDEHSLGGLILATKDGQIVFDNTLDARIEIVFKQQLPEVREFYFLFFYFTLIFNVYWSGSMSNYNPRRINFKCR